MVATIARNTHRRAKRTCYVTAPATIMALYLWTYDVVSWAPTPLEFALYHVLLLTTVIAACTAAMARIQIGIAQAFAAGYNTALAVVDGNDDGDGDGGHHKVPAMPLRLVE